jgi:hypothetical protein
MGALCFVALNDDGDVTGATHAARLMMGWTDDMIKTPSTS